MDDEPVVSEEGLRSWATFLQNDAKKNGGTASTLLRLKPDSRPVKVTCCSQIVIIEMLTELEFALERANFLSVD